MSPGGCYATTLWSQSLDNSQGWHTVMIPVSPYARAETFYFSVYQRETIPVSVAFDDIGIDQCDSLTPSSTTTSTSTSMSTTTSIIVTTKTSRVTTKSTTRMISTFSSTLTKEITSTMSTPTSMTTTRSNAYRPYFLSGFSFITIYIPSCHI